MGKRGPKPKVLIPTEWSPQLAYAVGLLTTDGCLSKDKRHIDLTSADKEQVETFRDCLGLSHIMIGTKTSGPENPRRYYCVQFGSILFYAWLLEIGLTPNKSKTLGALAIPDKFFFDFLRGCFDGDGSMYGYWDPRWHSSYMFYLALASASPHFLKWLEGSIMRLTGVGGRISEGSRVYQLRYAKANSRILLERIYHTDSDETPCLMRKFTKVQKILRIDAEHSE